MPVRVDLRVPVGRPLPELAEFVRFCEDAGFHGVGINDHHHAGRDVYAALTLAAAGTERIRLFPATSNPLTRHPLVLAAAVNSLAELAPGWIMLSLAPGFRSVEQTGHFPTPRRQLGEAVIAVRKLVAGQDAVLGGQQLSMHNASATSPSVYMLASGPKMLELAGEIADGVLMLVGIHPAGIAAARAHLRAGEQRAGRKPGTVQEVFILPTAIEPFATAREWPRRFYRPGTPFLCYPSSSNLRWLRESGTDLSADHDPSAIGPGLAGTICEALGLFGPAGYCAERLLQAHEESGLEHVFLFPSHTAETAYELPESEVRAFREVIGPRLMA